jgi:hemerythrin-like domain-containing protein
MDIEINSRSADLTYNHRNVDYICMTLDEEEHVELTINHGKYKRLYKGFEDLIKDIENGERYSPDEFFAVLEEGGLNLG